MAASCYVECANCLSYYLRMFRKRYPCYITYGGAGDVLIALQFNKRCLAVRN